MAKISRNALKGLIKECLVEILQEGLSADGLDAITERKAPRKRTQQARSRKASIALPGRQAFNPALDTPVSKQRKSALSERISPAIASVSSDPTMQSLLEDTANTTLRRQGQAENHRGPQSQSDIPLEALGMMGAETSTWETLAFSDAQVDMSAINIK
jgi:hypothetical protein